MSTPIFHTITADMYRTPPNYYIERTFIGDGNDAFTTTQINSAGLVKEVKHYEPAFAEVANRATEARIIEAIFFMHSSYK